MIKVGIGVIVVGVLMILGSDGVKFVLKQPIRPARIGPDKTPVPAFRRHPESCRVRR
jgi:hypothetical protein